MVNPWNEWRPLPGRGTGVHPILGKSGQPLYPQPATATAQATGSATPFAINLAPKAKGSGKGTGKEPSYPRTFTLRDVYFVERPTDTIFTPGQHLEFY